MKITDLVSEASFGRATGRAAWDSNMPGYQGDYGGEDNWDSGKRDFKKREHEAEWEQEKAYSQKLAAQDAGPWYLRVDGKILKSQGQAKIFDQKKGANNYALAIIKNNPAMQGKIMLTKSSEEKPAAEAASGGSSSGGNVASSSGRINPDSIVV